MDEDRDSQPGVDLVIDFVNTLDLESDVDKLSTPQELASWLGERSLMDSELPLSDADLLQAIRLREALRELMLANNGATADDHAGEELERVARGGDLGVRFASSGSMSLAPGADGFPGALARVLLPVAHALSDGSWQRVKACRCEDCQWAFYDRSRNRAGVWCDMATCGNRTKVRAYRERTPSNSR